MNLYRIFIAAFAISILALIIVLFSYIQALTQLLADTNGEDGELMARNFIRSFLTPAFLISAIVLGLSSLAYRVIGIVCAARNRTIDGGEKAMWIIGFIMLGFITAIVFLVLARSRNMLTAPEMPQHMPGKHTPL